MLTLISPASKVPSQFPQKDFKLVFHSPKLDTTILFSWVLETLLLVHRSRPTVEIPLKQMRPYALSTSDDFLLCVSTGSQRKREFKILCIFRSVWVREFSFDRNIYDMFW